MKRNGLNIEINVGGEKGKGGRKEEILTSFLRFFMLRVGKCKMMRSLIQRKEVQTGQKQISSLRFAVYNASNRP